MHPWNLIRLAPAEGSALVWLFAAHHHCRFVAIAGCTLALPVAVLAGRAVGGGLDDKGAGSAPALAGSPIAAPAKVAFRYADSPWSLALPAVWVQATDAQLAAMNDAAKAAIADRPPTYVAAFVMAAGEGPYALVQIHAGMPATASYDDVRVAFNLKQIAGAVQKAIPTSLGEFTLGQAVLDEGRNRIVTPFEIGPADGRLRAMTVAYLGKDSMVSMHCYSPVAGYEDALPAMQSLADGFAFDAGAGFVAGAGMRKGFNYAELVIGAAVGISVAVIVALIRKARRKATPA